MMEVLIVLSVILLDRVTKMAAMAWLAPVGSIPLWDGVFHLSYHTNTGAAFSILSGKTTLLGLFSVAISIALIIYMVRYSKTLSKPSRLGLAFILGGAIGNGFDRLFYGAVVDFFDFRLIRFAIFNVADSFITVGVVLLILGFLAYDKEFLQ